MSKNTTLKGLALGAGVALVASTFGFAPANALGQSDTSFISLSPRTGTEYTVLADQYFDLKSNTIDSLAGTGGKDLKFLVSDPQSKVLVDQSQATTTPVIFSEAAGTGANDLASALYDATGGNTEKLTTVTVDTTALLAGEKLFIYGLTNTAAAAALNGEVVTRASGTTAITNKDLGAGDVTYNVADGLAASTTGLNTRATILANNAIDADLFETATITTAIAGKTITGGRATDGTFVVNTEVNANANDRLLRLVSTSTSTYSVVVTAWVDSNDNGLIDSTEFASPERTVTFQKAADVTAVTTLNPVVGAATMSATVTTTPTLNGEQVVAQDKNFLNAKFTRSSIATAIYAEVDKGAGGDQTAVWSDVSKSWTVNVSLDADTADEASLPSGVQVGDAWGALVGPTDRDHTAMTSVSVATTGVATIVTAADHNLTTGDLVTVAIAAAEVDAVEVAAEATRPVTVTGARSFTYVMTETTKPAAAATDATLATDTLYTVETYAAASQGLIDRVGAETYSATAVIQTAANEALEASWTAISSISTTGVSTASATTGDVTTAATASVQGKSFDDNAGANTVKVKTGTLSVPVTFTAYDSLLAPVSAGRPVVVTLSAETGDAFSVNGNTTTATVLTDANGQATVTVTSANGYAASTVKVTGVTENAVTVHADLAWATQVFGLTDLNTTAAAVQAAETRTMQKLGSYTMKLAVMDQWFTVPTEGLYRLKLTGEGVTSSFVTLTNGQASVTVTDTGVFGTQVVSDIALEKMSGATVVATTAFQITADIVTTFKVVLGADASTTYGTAADLSDLVAAKALLELDKRVEAGLTPVYTNDVLVNGRVMDSATSAGKVGAIVTISGPSNVLFSNGEKAARGSLTFLSGTAGNFEVQLYSTSAQTDSVITVTTNGVSSTVKVSFSGIGVGEGTSLVITAPAAVKPASTFQVKAKLTDVYGNGVAAAAGRVKVTYTGAGIVFGTLPTSTDASGELSFAVLLGSNDTGTVSVTVSYDQNGDTDFVDAKDLTTTSSTAINATGVVAADTKVNVGSFKGYVALYAKGYKGSKMSAIVAGKWIVVDSLASDFERVVRYTGAGYDIVTTIYIDGVSVQSFNVTTK